MDTSLRGELGDEIVLRVKAPFADYWRGQTYSEFDGTTWSIDDRGRHAHRRARSRDRSGRRRRQLSAVTSSSRPSTSTSISRTSSSLRRRHGACSIDAPLWQRADGALRAGVVIPAGSVYTVVSERSTTDDRGAATGAATSRSCGREPSTSSCPTRRPIGSGSSQRRSRPGRRRPTTRSVRWRRGSRRTSRTTSTHRCRPPVPTPSTTSCSRRKLGFCEQIATATGDHAAVARGSGTGGDGVRAEQPRRGRRCVDQSRQGRPRVGRGAASRSTDGSRSTRRPPSHCPGSRALPRSVAS